MGLRSSHSFKLDSLPAILTHDELLGMFADAEIDGDRLRVSYTANTYQPDYSQEIRHMINGAAAYKARVLNKTEYKDSKL